MISKVKRGIGSDAMLGCPVSILYVEGKYMPGDSIEQWRAEGNVEEIDVSYFR